MVVQQMAQMLKNLKASTNLLVGSIGVLSLLYWKIENVVIHRLVKEEVKRGNVAIVIEV
jgi:hypothetical protein